MAIAVKTYAQKFIHYATFDDSPKKEQKFYEELFRSLELNEYQMYHYSDGDFYYPIVFTEKCAAIKTEEELQDILEDMSENEKYEEAKWLEFEWYLRPLIPQEIIDVNKFALWICNG